MLYYGPSWRRLPKPCHRIFYLIICSFIIGCCWTILTGLLLNIDEEEKNVDEEESPVIFCFVLSANDRHLTSSRAIIYSWGKRCDRFYFVTRLQNTSVELMMLPQFENLTDITPNTINSITGEVLLYLQGEQLFSSYQWFLRASDDCYVIIPHLCRLITRLNRREMNEPMVYVGDVEEMYEKYGFVSTGSVMIFNRAALNLFHSNPCDEEVIYDHELIECLREIGMRVNPIEENLIYSQNLSIYRMDQRLKVNLRRISRLRPYHVEYTSSRPITEVKQRRARLVLGWVTAWEYRVS